MIRFKEFIIEDKEEYLYHVTKTSNLPAIKKEGIKPGLIVGTSNWTNRSDKRYGDGSIYAHSDYDDAVRNATKMDWEHHKETGSGKMAVIKFKKVGDWEKDPSEDFNNQGHWVKQKRHATIKPEHIVSTEILTTKQTRKLV